MFDTPTTAFYHGPSQHNKGLLSNIPSAFPTQIFSSPFSLGGYFQQSSQQPSSQQEAKLSSEPSSNATVTSEPTAPQQPTHTNRRTQRRAKQQPQNSISSSIAAAAQQRVVVANSNMGNVNTAMAQPSNFIASTSNAASSSHHHHHVTNRRKKSSNKINRKKVDDAITLSAFAVEQDSQGNHDVAMDFYLTAVENMLEALPIHSNQSRRDALKNKLKEFMDRTGLSDEVMGSTNASSSARTNEPEEPPSSNNGPKMSHQIIQAAINSAVALKQSPIPDAISATVNYTMKKFQKIDETYGLQEKAWEVSRSGMELALEIDQQYNIHEKVSNAFFVGLAAAMRATIAYKDAPSYRQLRKMSDVSNSHNCKEVATEC